MTVPESAGKPAEDVPADPGPYVPPSKEDVLKDQAHNDARIEQFQQRNGVGLSEASIVRIRLALLVDQLLGDLDQPARREHEDRCNKAYASALDNVESEVNRRRLVEGVQLRRPR